MRPSPRRNMLGLSQPWVRVLLVALLTCSVFDPSPGLPNDSIEEGDVYVCTKPGLRGEGKGFFGFDHRFSKGDMVIVYSVKKKALILQTLYGRDLLGKEGFANAIASNEKLKRLRKLGRIEITKTDLFEYFVRYNTLQTQTRDERIKLLDAHPLDTSLRLSIAGSPAESLVYSDELVSIAFMHPVSFKRFISFNFAIHNITESPLQFAWEESSYVAPRSASIRLVSQQASWDTRNQPRPPALIPPRARLEVVAIPENRLRFDRLRRVDPVLNEFLGAEKTLLGHSFYLYLGFHAANETVIKQVEFVVEAVEPAYSSIIERAPDLQISPSGY